MTGVELTERLIGDLKETIRIRSIIPDCETQINHKGLGIWHSLADFATAIKFDDFDNHLNLIVLIVNIGEKVLIHYDKNDISDFLNYVIQNSSAINRKLQYFIDHNPNMKLNNEKFNALLFYRLELLHLSAKQLKST